MPSYFPVNPKLWRQAYVYSDCFRAAVRRQQLRSTSQYISFIQPTTDTDEGGGEREPGGSFDNVACSLLAFSILVQKWFHEESH